MSCSSKLIALVSGKYFDFSSWYFIAISRCGFKMLLKIVINDLENPVAVISIRGVSEEPQSQVDPKLTVCFLVNKKIIMEIIASVSVIPIKIIGIEMAAKF